MNLLSVVKRIVKFEEKEMKNLTPMEVSVTSNS